MKPEALQRHVEELCAANRIRWWPLRSSRDAAYALRAEYDEGTVGGESWAPPVRGDLSYATALHEIGHILGQHQNSQRKLVRERWAWIWARQNARTWTQRMERDAQRCLQWYAERVDDAGEAARCACGGGK